MRVLICGDRNWEAYQPIEWLIGNLPEGSVVIEGEARGADTIARNIAEVMGYEVERYPADWSKYGRAAGPIRNKQMLDVGRPDEVHAFHDSIENSKGTLNMLKQASKAGVICYLHTSDGEIRTFNGEQF